MKNLLLNILKLKADNLVEERLANVSGCPEPLKSAVEYALTTGGKRLRPVLAMLGARIAGSTEDVAADFAVAVEFVHTYSLVHDDLPCMDDDDLRRGKPTLHVKFGESIAVLAGDALLNLAYETLFDAIKQSKSDGTVEAASLLATSAGMFGMIKGQIMDISTEPTPPETVGLFKTGKLFKAALVGGAAIGGASDGLKQALSEYADNFGKAFQIVDDLDDYIKGERSDANYVVCYGAAKAKSDAAELIEKAKLSVKPFAKREELWSLADEISDKIGL